MDSVRIGLVGAGVIGAAHSAVLQQIARQFGDQVQLVAVADPDAAHREFFTQVYGYREAYASAVDLFALADINTVFVCTPTKYHAELVHAAAARGWPIFCEKPLAMNYREGAGMVAAVEAAGCPTQIGLVLRYSAVYTVLRELTRAAEAGPARAVVFRDDQCIPIRGLHDSPWRADPAMTAGGTLIEHGVHDLDILTWMFGPIARVRAWQREFAGHPGIEDYVAAEIEFESGVRAQLMNLWHSILQRHSNRRVEIFCEQGFLASEHDMAGEVSCQFGAGPERTMSAEEVLRRFIELRGAEDHVLREWFGAAYLVQDLAFVEDLLAGRRPSPSLRDGLEAQRLAEAVYESARSGREIEVGTFVPS